MATAGSELDVGPQLRAWRERRRLTQLDLALDAGVSTRHLSFVETGRSRPGRDTLVRVLRTLDVPLREQNRLLLAAGHAPAFAERGLADPELAPVRHALHAILTGHEPNPAIAVDRGWNLVAANSAVQSLSQGLEIDPKLLEPPVNAVRASLHPRGLAPRIVNLGAWIAFFRERLERQLAITGDEDLAALIEEVAGYPAPDDEEAEPPQGVGGSPGPLRLRVPDGGELSFLGMFATFDMPFDVTTSELAVELLFPADRGTADALRALSPTAGRSTLAPPSSARRH
jgi:transcriptional regulator with XRE-family HTH domain